MHVIHRECLVALLVFVCVGACNYPLFRGGFYGVIVSVINSEDTVSVRRF